jgi:hypothetical protein
MFHNTADARIYLLAGNATVTFESIKTSKHFTYKVRRCSDRFTNKPLDKWMVALLSGPNNEADFSYLGMLDANGFRLTAKSRANADAPSVKAFAWTWNLISADRDLETAPIHIHHNGHCGKCGRTLTVPESIERGIGPECATKMGIG